MYLIVGLGNPGREYDDTRHNIGFQVIDALSKEFDIPINIGKFNSLYGEARIDGKRVFLVKPTTYMNNSGQALEALRDFYKIDNENILVIYDDIDLPLASLRLLKKGSSGSHNGMRSIIKHLKTSDFPRFRIGIDGGRGRMDLASYVLAKFKPEEKKALEEKMDLIIRGVELFIKKDIEAAMNDVNRRK